MSLSDRQDQPVAVVNEVVSSVSKAASNSKGVEYEAFVKASARKSITVRSDNSKEFSFLNERTLFLRVIKDGRMGVSYTNDFRPKRVQECFRTALRLSSQHPKNESLVGFPSHVRKYPHVSGLYDRAVARLEYAEANDMMDEMLDAVPDSKKAIQMMRGGVFATLDAIGICNSNGIDVSMSSTDLRAACSAVSGKGKSISPECISTGASRKKNLDLRGIGGMCSFIASLSSVKSQASTGERDVVFSPMSLGSFESGLLTIMLSRALSGMEVVNCSTAMADRLGGRVASGSLSIRDAPTVPGRDGSRPFDDEGVPTSDRWLIRKGILESFVWDNQFGSRSGTGSTGNATRDMNSGLVTPAPLVMEVSPGKGDMHDLVSEVDDGYLVWDCQGAHTGSPETGAFSFVASPGLRIVRGDVVGGVEGVMLSGDIIDLLCSVERTGSDSADLGCSVMPSILFRNVNITTG